MKDIIKERVYQEAVYILKTKKTLRELAKIFNFSKSTIYNDLKERLKEINLSLYNEVQAIFQDHLKTRHLKGGLSTKKKYQKKALAVSKQT